MNLHATQSQLTATTTNGIGLRRKSLLSELRSRNIRLTPQRRAVVEEIQSADQHVDAKSLLEKARQRDVRVDRATVYRTLTLLKKSGLIDELDLMHLHGEKHYYEARTSRDHVHLACFYCGTIAEFTSPSYEALKEEIQRNSGFSVEVVRLEVGGRCASCRDSEKGKAAKG